MKLIIFISLITFLGCTDYTAVPGKKVSVQMEDVSHGAEIVCLNGHQYYKGFGVRLNDNGLPIRCRKIKRR